MPTYNWLSHLAGTVGNGAITVRNIRSGINYQTTDQSLKITTDFKPYYIAVTYGSKAKRAVIIYDYEKSIDTCALGTTEEYMHEQELGSTEFNIQSIDDDGFTLAPTTIATADAQLWWLAIGDGPSITYNCSTGVTPIIANTYFIPLDYKPMFFAGVRADSGQGFFYTEKRTSNWINAVSDSSYTTNTSVNYNADPSVWGALTENGIIIYNSGNEPLSFYYFIVRGD